MLTIVCDSGRNSFWKLDMLVELKNKTTFIHNRKSKYDKRDINGTLGSGHFIRWRSFFPSFSRNSKSVEG